MNAKDLSIMNINCSPKVIDCEGLYCTMAGRKMKYELGNNGWLLWKRRKPGEYSSGDLLICKCKRRWRVVIGDAVLNEIFSTLADAQAMLDELLARGYLDSSQEDAERNLLQARIGSTRSNTNRKEDRPMVEKIFEVRLAMRTTRYAIVRVTAPDAAEASLRAESEYINNGQGGIEWAPTFAEHYSIVDCVLGEVEAVGDVPND